MDLRASWETVQFLSRIQKKRDDLIHLETKAHTHRQTETFVDHNWENISKLTPNAKIAKVEILKMMCHFKYEMPVRLEEFKLWI